MSCWRLRRCPSAISASLRSTRRCLPLLYRRRRCGSLPSPRSRPRFVFRDPIRPCRSGLFAVAHRYRFPPVCVPSRRLLRSLSRQVCSKDTLRLSRAHEVILPIGSFSFSSQGGSWCLIQRVSCPWLMETESMPNLGIPPFGLLPSDRFSRSGAPMMAMRRSFASNRQTNAVSCPPPAGRRMCRDRPRPHNTLRCPLLLQTGLQTILVASSPPE
ncbi:hypothetical protein SDC9_104714 [bioreactor metagenome]|uniref:Uncharacterized protein n=1 Tax=bioreactor metagenome TaxID=1076179 RepID=A0A645AXK7_9ZZZZ